MTGQRYQVVRGIAGRYAICDVLRMAQPDFTVDWYRTRPAAQYHADRLNAGAARVDPHAVIGCKVVES